MLAAAAHIAAQMNCEASRLFFLYLAGAVSRSCISATGKEGGGCVGTLENSDGLLKGRGDTHIGSLSQNLKAAAPLTLSRT